MKIKFIPTLVALFMVLCGNTFAREILSAPQALEKASSGEVILIDIRSREEWKETGVASVAIPLSMHEKGFLEGFDKIRKENPGKEIALICATGGRTKYLQSELKKRGFGETIDISEGMMGNGKAPGWIKRGLAIKKLR